MMTGKLMQQITNEIGVVIIGRNEGDRLVQCIESAKTQIDKIIYVDSNSSDNSIQNASEREVETVQLDMSIPFSAARARNVGWQSLIKKYPRLKYIHFIDGDCIFFDDWINKAHNFLDNHPGYAVVCGKRCEKFPDNSIYNALCDVEWDTPTGDTLSCGGDALITVKALQSVNGYTNRFIAGEEPEMCFRMRNKGWKIHRLDAKMTNHDAAINKFSQWWKRAKRCGYAYALGFDAHGHSPEKYKKKQTLSALVWGAIFPILTIFCAITLSPVFLILLAMYPFQIWRLYRSSKLHKPLRTIWACLIVIAKFPESLGVLEFYLHKVLRKQSTLIEYK